MVQIRCVMSVKMFEIEVNAKMNDRHMTMTIAQLPSACVANEKNPKPVQNIFGSLAIKVPIAPN